MAARIDELMNKSIGVLSLCEFADSRLMWPHLGDSHCGFVIAFDTSAPFFHQAAPPVHVNASAEEVAQLAEEYGRLWYIRYWEERPSVVVTDMPPEYADVKPPHQQGQPVCLFSVPLVASKPFSSAVTPIATWLPTR